MFSFDGGESYLQNVYHSTTYGLETIEMKVRERGPLNVPVIQHPAIAQ